MRGIELLLVVSGLSTGLGIGVSVWGWRAGHVAARYLGAGLVLHGLAQLGFYLVWTYAPFSR